MFRLLISGLLAFINMMLLSYRFGLVIIMVLLVHVHCRCDVYAASRHVFGLVLVTTIQPVDLVYILASLPLRTSQTILH